MRAKLLAMATVLACGATLPAVAAWDRIGSVDVSPYRDQATQFNNIPGRVDELSLQARRDDVMCRDVTATFDNGDRRDVFHGRIPEGRDVTVDLRGRRVQSLDFDCRTEHGDRASVDIAANIDRDDSRRNPAGRFLNDLFNQR
jgi:hypothetical protein